MTNHRALPAPMSAYRIGDPDGMYPIWSGQGAKENAGRWNDVGLNVIYASQYYSTAMLEKLVHYSGGMPGNQHYLEITVPAGISYEVVTPDTLPGWNNKNQLVSRAFGNAWYNESRSAVLIVPSIVARVENNFVLNASHPEFTKITTDLETPIWWDERLFG